MGEGMLDNICIVQWMSSPNTPIPLTISLTNCTILSQEIYCGASQYYKCNLLMSDWRHSLCLTVTQIDFTRPFDTSTSPWWQCWLLDKRDKWSWPPYFNIKPVPPTTYWWIWMPLHGVKISTGTETRSSSTVILFCDIASWRELSWSSCRDEKQGLNLVLYTDAHGNVIFDDGW